MWELAQEVLGQAAAAEMELFQWVSTGGAVAALLLFLYGFKAEWWVTGKVYRERVEEATQCRDALSHYRDRVEDRVIPLLTEATRAVTELAELEKARTRTRYRDE